MRKCVSLLAMACALVTSSAAFAETKKCPFNEEGSYPWSANIPHLMDGDLWAWVYLDLDKGGWPERCYIGESNITGNETKSDLCRNFVARWQATPLMKDGVRVAGTTRRKVVIIGKRHQQLFDEARKSWFAQHPDESPACYPGSANE